MKVEVITDKERVREIARPWEEVYNQDSVIAINKSWPWMSGWLETTDLEWVILAVRKGARGDYVAFFPLARRRNTGGKSVFYPGGYPLAAHAGFVCAEDYTGEVLPALSSYIDGRLSWDRFELRDFDDCRLDSFIRHYQGSCFRIAEKEPTVCPYIPLSGSYEDYLRDFVGPETRKTLKKKYRRIKRSEDITTTEPNGNDIGRHVSILLDLWQRRWGMQPEPFHRQVVGILQSCFRAGFLHLQVMWRQDTPVAGIAVYMDISNRLAQCFMSAYDDSVRHLSAGNLLILESIRRAAKNNISFYDFGRGPQEYKYRIFGAQNRYNSNITICRTNMLDGVKSRMRNLISRIPSVSRNTEPAIDREKI